MSNFFPEQDRQGARPGVEAVGGENLLHGQACQGKDSMMTKGMWDVKCREIESPLAQMIDSKSLNLGKKSLKFPCHGTWGNIDKSECEEH